MRMGQWERGPILGPWLRAKALPVHGLMCELMAKGRRFLIENDIVNDIKNISLLRIPAATRQSLRGGPGSRKCAPPVTCAGEAGSPLAPG